MDVLSDIQSDFHGCSFLGSLQRKGLRYAKALNHVVAGFKVRSSA